MSHCTVRACKVRKTAVFRKIFSVKNFSLRLTSQSISDFWLYYCFLPHKRFDVKESAHAIAGGRTGTAVVMLVGAQVGLSARRVRRERRGPAYHAHESRARLRTC